MQVRFSEIDSHSIFNLTSPRFLPEISLNWRGKEPWHADKYEPVRDLMEQVYVDGFNQATGHYRKLEQSIKAEGIRNPIIVSLGGLQRRATRELPPGTTYVCEYLGGSRLWVAQRMGLRVPCIVNDYTGHGASMTHEEVMACFAEKPRQMWTEPDGSIYVNDLPYHHLPGVTLADQSKTRRGIVTQVHKAVQEWLTKYD